jgi:hypothetical protein
MDFRKDAPTLAQLRQLNIVVYLASLGYEPTRVRGCNHWYLSPLRNERTASFKVNAKINRWYDFGVGKGGSILDFCMLYFRVDLPAAAAALSGLSLPSRIQMDGYEPKVKQPGLISVLDCFEISSTALIGYLSKRGISIPLANKYCREIRYRNGEKIYYGIGFPNDLRGWEIRSEYFKGSASPKSVTTLRYGHETVCVFEGLFDFLTYREIALQLQLRGTDFLVLNSLSFAGSMRELLSSYQSIRLFLDNDPAGKNVSGQLSALGSAYNNMSYLYATAGDLNEFWIKSGRDTSVFDVIKDIPP